MTTMKDIMTQATHGRFVNTTLTFHLFTDSDASRLSQRILTDIRDLLSHSADEQLTWVGSKTDLFTLIHMAYVQERITTPDGLPVTFSHLCGIICLILHVRMPRNPFNSVQRNAQRKGRYARPLQDRYTNIWEFVQK